LPQLSLAVIPLKPCEVKDRTDGKLVHLDGLISHVPGAYMALQSIQNIVSQALIQIANRHLEAALPHIASGEYMGEHWLASFGVYALTMQ
jgi:hypothetical protein